MRDFYSTMAQVFPVLMLALVWESSFLEQLRRHARPPRSLDHPSGVKFWTKPRVRIWIIGIVVAATAELSLSVLVLAGALPDTVALRAVVLAGLGVVLASLLTRAIVDTLDATRER